MRRLLQTRLRALPTTLRANWRSAGIVLILWCLLVLPSSFLLGLLPLDLGANLDIAQRFSAYLDVAFSPYNGSGRFYPVYFLHLYALYSAAGLHLRWYYFAQSAMFLLSALLLASVFRRMVAHHWIVPLFCISIFLSTPNLENLYTVCKCEPLIYFFVVLALFITYNRGRRLGLSHCIAVALCFTCAMWSKETALAMFGFCAAGLATAAYFKRSTPPSRRSPGLLYRYTQLSLSIVAGWVMAKLPLLIAQDTTNGQAGYTAYSITSKIVTENLAFYCTQQPDVAGFGVIASVLLALTLKRASKLDDKSVCDLVFVISLLCLAWGYSCIFMIWKWPMPYYLFLPAVLFRVSACYGLYMMIRLQLCGRAFRIGVYTATAALMSYAAIYLWYTGSTEVSYTQMYTAAIRNCLAVSRAGDPVYWESFPFYSEELINTGDLMSIVFHQGRRAYGIADVVDPGVVTPEMKAELNVTDEALASNEQNLPREGGYEVIMTGDKLATWRIRGAAPLYADESVLQKDGSYEMGLVREERLYRPSLFLNVWTYWPDLKPSYVGYKIYKVVKGPRFAWFGRFPDGWMGKRARLVLYPEFVATALVHVSTSPYNPHNEMSLFRDETLVEKVALSPGKEHTFILATARDGKPAVFRFEVTQTFVPEQVSAMKWMRKYVFLNGDRRELGALIRFEPFAASDR